MFLVAGFSKLYRIDQFAVIVESYGIVPSFLRPIFARLLPTTEVVIGAGLVLGMLVPLLSMIALGLLSLFTLVVVFNLRRGNRGIPCGCFGSTSGRGIGWPLIVRNLVLVAMGAILLYASLGSYESLGALLPNKGSVTSLLVLAPSVLVAVAIVFSLAIFESLFSPAADSRHAESMVPSR